MPAPFAWLQLSMMARWRQAPPATSGDGSALGARGSWRCWSGGAARAAEQRSGAVGPAASGSAAWMVAMGVETVAAAVVALSGALVVRRCLLRAGALTVRLERHRRRCSASVLRLPHACHTHPRGPHRPCARRRRRWRDADDSWQPLAAPGARCVRCLFGRCCREARALATPHSSAVRRSGCAY